MSSDLQSSPPENHSTAPHQTEEHLTDAIPIGELVVREDYPQCMVGQTVEIRGIVGRVTQLAGQSLKIRQAEGRMQSFNVHVLRKLYSPPVRYEPGAIANAPTARSHSIPSDTLEPSQAPAPEPEPEPQAEPEPGPEPETPTRLEVAKPDFSAPLVSIVTLLQRSDFPRGVLGVHVDIGGFTGVVVEVMNQSLRVLSPEGQRRKYNGPALRKLYGGK